MKRKYVPIEDFETEKNAKNETYHFIIAYGLIDVFKAFCKENNGKDHYNQCIKILTGTY